MKKIFFITLVVAAITSIATPPKLTAPVVKNSVTIDDNAIIINNNDEMEIAVEANQQDVLISGNNNMIKISGTCKNVLITGKGNDVEIDSVNQIIIKGNYNFVSWLATQNTTGKPIITDNGGYNNVGKRSSDAQKK